MPNYTANGTIVLGDRLRQCYEGDVEGGLRHGHGAYAYANGVFRYEGEYVKGRKQGMFVSFSWVAGAMCLCDVQLTVFQSKFRCQNGWEENVVRARV